MSFSQFTAMQTADPVTIRPARPEEAPLLTRLAMRSKAHWGYEQSLLDAWTDDLEVAPHTCNGESVWVLETAGSVAGFGMILIKGESALLDDLWIDPDFMGRGLGQQLFRHLRENAIHRGATRMRIEAYPHATGFYEHMGASIVGEVASTIVPGRSLSLMEIDLQ